MDLKYQKTNTFEISELNGTIVISTITGFYDFWQLHTCSLTVNHYNNALQLGYDSREMHFIVHNSRNRILNE